MAQNQPTNVNMLSPVGFRFLVKKLPKTNFFIQACNLPGIALNESDGLPTPFTRLPVPGDHMTFNELQISFRVDEDFANYIELYNWIRALGFPETFQQANTIYQTSNSIFSSAGGDTVFTDATLMVLNSAMNPNIEVTFRQMVIISLSDLTFDSRSPDIDYVECNATFRYRDFVIKKL